MIDVAVVGCGAIGGIVARALHAGEVPHARLAGVVDPKGADGLPLLGLDEAVDRADLVVEAAGQAVLAGIGPRVVASGTDLLVVSVGALTDQALLDRLREAGPGAVHLATGAVGGLDLLRSAARMAPLDRVRIVTTKKPPGLVQPWMDDAEAARLRSATEAVEVRRGPAREIAAAFPRSANVAAAVALAVGDWDAVEAVVVADPAAELTSHVITAAGAAGEYRFEIRNRPSPDNPTTSQVVPYAVLKAVGDLAARTGGFR
ncbi:aspartate dehydrogenase domain-containing protein [Actinomadura sp. NPDC048394]|uniref:aspartate dehydrogenase domain-containing protein n=1 Tax=Actinomadura sp. NPDC048394 TaxID=3158223 RepID=UPI0033DBE4FF